MSLSDLAALGSFVSGFAVLASLIYLALQVRQAEKNQKAMVQVERAARGANHLRFLADPGINEAYQKGRDGQPDITPRQLYQYLCATRAAVVSWEDTYFQHQQKLLDDASFESTLATVRQFLSFPGSRAMWKRQRSRHEQSFRDFMDELLDEVEVVNPQSWEEDLASWHREIAAELSMPHLGEENT